MSFSASCSPFLRICHRNLHTKSSTGSRIGVLGVNLSKGQPKLGVDDGPDVIRSTNFIKTLQNDLGTLKDYTITDYGNIKPEFAEKDEIVKKIRNPTVVGNTCKKVSQKAQQILKNGDLLLTLGGDHSIAIGTIHGHAQVEPNICVIWVDAHADINTSTTSNSGNMHGMVMSFHLHELEQYKLDLPGFDWIKPCLTGKDIVYIGLRDVEPLESDLNSAHQELSFKGLILEKCGIKVFSMEDVDRFGILDVTKKALDAVNPKRNRPIHVSFDIDAYDTSVAPSTGTSVHGGLTLREGLTLAEEIHNTGLLTGLDLVEVNTSIGTPFDREKTLLATKETLLAFFGNVRGGNLPVADMEIPRML